MAITCIRLSSLSLGYPDRDTPVVRDVNLVVQRGEFVVVVGANGSGKSSLLRGIQGLLQPTGGTVEFERDSPRTERELVQVYQDPRRGTIGGMTVLENLRLAAMDGKATPWRRLAAPRDRAWFEKEAEKAGLKNRLDDHVDTLSQGQRQLLALHLALLRDPSVLLADEHTGALDPSNARLCLEATARLASERKLTVVMVTHDLPVALNFGSRLIVLRDGRLAADLDQAQKVGLTLERLFALCGYISSA